MLSWDSMILTEHNDALWHLDKVKFIKQFIENLNSDWFWDKETSDRLIALYGNRWSGKSSIMKTLSYEFNEIGETNSHCLDHTKFKMVFFEARRYEQDPNLALSLLHFICNEVNIDLENKIWSGKHVWLAIKSLLRLAGWSLPVDLWKAADLNDNYISEEKEKIETLIHQNSFYTDQNDINDWFKKIFSQQKKKIVIFIDDLDRCEPEHVTNLLAAIKLFFTLSDKLIFVVWIDKDAVTKALQIKYHDVIKAEEYLEKIFMISFNITQAEDIWALINLYFQHNEKLRINIIELCNYIWFTNPRHLKKLLNKVQYLNSYIKGIIWWDSTNTQIWYYLVYILFSIIYEFYNESWIDIDLNFEKKNNSYKNITYTTNERQKTLTYIVNSWANMYKIDSHLYYSLVTHFLPVNQIKNYWNPFAQRIDYSLQSFLSFTSQNFKNEIHKKIIEYLLINPILTSEFKTLEQWSTQKDQFDNEIVKKIIEFIKNSF